MKILLTGGTGLVGKSFLASEGLTIGLLLQAQANLIFRPGKNS